MSENQSRPEKPRLTVIRWIFAIIGALIMIFAGGCSLYAFWVLTGPDMSERLANALGIVALFGGIPFLAGLLIWWLAVKAGR